jgi:hypothetical protein
MMDLERLVVTIVGLGLMVAVNLYFFTRPRGGSALARSGQRAVKPGPETAAEPRVGGSRMAQPGFTRPEHAPPASLPSSKEP